MKDPYQKAFEQINDALRRLNEMIIELALRTLTISEYKEFAKAIEKDKNQEEEIKKGTA